MTTANPYTTYRKWFSLGLFVQVVAAWFSVGYNHYDEHFQVLEFCNYKLGLSPAAALPWEFSTQCRGALQPFIAYSFCKALQVFGLYNPFWVAFLLRFCMGVLTWLVTCRLVKLLLPEFKTERGRHIYVLAAFLLWFVAYCGVRFSAENIAGVLFFLALGIILELQANSPAAKRSVKLVMIGLLLGFVFMLRLQMAFAYIGLGMWLLLYSKWCFSDWLLIIFFGLVAIGIGAIADHWFYEAWVFTPYNYFKVNILQHAAAKFGVFPWWYYFTLFFNYAIPPVSIVLLPLFFIGIWQRPRHLFTWVSIAFIAGHCFIGHKEMRFLLPVTAAFIFLSCIGLNWLMEKYQGKWFLGWPLKTIIVINTLILFGKIIIPSHESIPYYQFIYNHARLHPTILVSFEQSPYHLVDLNSNFYRCPGLEEVIVHKPEEIADVLKNANGKSVLFLNPEINPIPVIAPFKKQQVYCLLPGWVRLLNFNDWQSRSYIWTIYQL
ncbi:MAG: hypothetical protein JWQ38_2397 [Flavipsychrobacter sp.]|nr:hypothetical protein [Flavipsychrobacter sp.]